MGHEWWEPREAAVFRASEERPGSTEGAARRVRRGQAMCSHLPGVLVTQTHPSPEACQMPLCPSRWISLLPRYFCPRDWTGWWLRLPQSLTSCDSWIWTEYLQPQELRAKEPFKVPRYSTMPVLARPVTQPCPYELQPTRPICPWDSQQDHWGGLPCPLPGDLPDPGIQSASPASLALGGRFFTSEPPGKLYSNK